MKSSNVKSLLVRMAGFCLLALAVHGQTPSWMKPDFIVTSLTLDPAAPAAGGAFTATVTILNQGDIPGDAGVVRMWVSKPGNAKAGDAGDAEQPGGNLAVGESRTLVFALTAPTQSKTHHARAFVDADNVTAEKSEGNNQKSATYTLHAPPTWMKPDFVVDSLTLDPAVPAAGGPFTATVTVRNQGDIPGDAGTVRMWVSKAGNAQAGDAGDAEQAAGPLAVGETRTLEFALTAAAKKGTHHARAYVDADDITDEKSEGNNQKSVTYTLHHDAPAQAAIELRDLEQIYDGTPRSVTVVTDPDSVPVRVVYAPGQGKKTAAVQEESEEPPVAAGSYAVTATADDPEFTGSTSDTLVVLPAEATVTLGNLEQIYNGQPRPVSVTTDPAGLAVMVTYDGAESAPVAPGSYAVEAVIADPNYQGAASAALTVVMPSYDSPAPLAAAYSVSGIFVEDFDGMEGTAAPGAGNALYWSVVANNAERAGELAYIEAGDTWGGVATAYNAANPDFPGDRSLNLYKTSATEPHRMTARFRNDSGLVVDSFEMTYDLECGWLRFIGQGNVAGFANVSFSTDGSQWMSMGSAFTAQVTDADAPAATRWLSRGEMEDANLTRRFVGGTFVPPVPLAPGQEFYIRWTPQQGGTSRRMHIGLDNLRLVFPEAVPPPPVEHTLTIASARGEATPAVGPHAVSGGSVQTNWISRSYAEDRTQYVTAGWTLTGGHVPAQGTEEVMSYLVSNDAVLTWLWRTNYLLEAAADAGGQVVGSVPGWIAKDSPVSIQAVADEGFGFAGWTGEVEPAQALDNPLEWSLDAPRAVTATFASLGPSPAIVTLDDLGQVYDGTPRSVSVATDPEGLAVEIAYDGSLDAPAGAGSYAVVATVVDPDYEGSAAGTLVVAKADQTVDFPAIGDKVTTDVVQLAATASSGLGVSFAVLSGPAVLNGAALTFTGPGAVSIAASQPGNANWNAAGDVVRTFNVSYANALEISRTEVNVREGGEGRFFVRLAQAPAGTVVVLTTRSEGSPDLRVKAGVACVFTPANWNAWQAVTLSADADANTENETAVFRVAASGMSERFVTATALDDDIGENVALAARGTTVTFAGASQSAALIDGIHDSSANFGHTSWTRTPPGWIRLDFQAPMVLSRMRLLNWDWTWRVHRYRIEGSQDGVNWTLLADAAEPRHGWDDWALDGVVARYVRFSGLSNSANSMVVVPEWEVYGTEYQPQPAAVVLGDLEQVCDGTPRAVTATTEPAGLAVAITYDGAGEPPVDAGSYSVLATVVDPLHSGSAPGTLVVAKAPAQILLGDLVQVYDGAPKGVSVDTDPGDLPVSVQYFYGEGSSSSGQPMEPDQPQPVLAGLYDVEATAGNENYEGFAGGLFEILPADQEIDFAPIADQTTADVVELAATASSALLVDFNVAEGPAVLNSGLLSFTGPGTVSVVASQPGDENWNPAPDVTRTFEVAAVQDLLELSRSEVNVREGGEGRFYVRLAGAPEGTVNVVVERLQGDGDVWITGGSVRTFTPANWNVWQPVTLAAGTDENGIDETAVFRLHSAGLATRLVEASVLDGDIGDNIALLSDGTTVTWAGASGARNLLNGIHADQTNHGYTAWTHTPPGWIRLDLQGPSAIERMRVLNTDWTYRLNRYVIEGSLDGETWTLLADASGEARHGWDDWEVTGGLYRYLRLTGLSNSVNFAVLMSEWEVYGERGSPLESQTIDFPAIDNQWVSNVVALSATASSGLPVQFAVLEGPAVLNGTTLSFTGQGTVRIRATQPGNEAFEPASPVERAFDTLTFASVLELSRSSVNVREGGEGRFFVRLRKYPGQNITVNATRFNGSASISVAQGSSLTFNAGNWNRWMPVTLAALDDGNAESESATIQLVAFGPGTAERFVQAATLDDDIGVNLALAANGAVIAGSYLATRPHMLIDGVHTVNGNYAHTIWNMNPSGWITLDLQTPVDISRIRLLNWDWTHRVHTYRLEGSYDGSAWVVLANADTPRHGWDELVIDADPVRFLRFTGTSNSVHGAVCIAELEVYGTPIDLPTEDLLEVSRTSIPVLEGGEGRFFIRLKSPPAGAVTVTVSRVSGDAGLSAPAKVYFNASNWNTWRAGTIVAAADANSESETATFRVTMPGADPVDVEAYTLDTDIGENLALAARGTTIADSHLATRPEQLIDGIHNQNGNYAHTIWNQTPPGWITIDLQEPMVLNRMRLLNWDWTYRMHRYQIEASLDGATWTVIALANEPRHGWDDWELDGVEARYLRFTGLNNSTHGAVAMAEWLVYGEPVPAPLIRSSSSASKVLPVAPIPPAAGDFDSIPVLVLTSDGPDDETGWDVLDGDPETAWVGQKLGGGYLVIGYEPNLELDAIEIDMAEESLIGFETLYSLDGEEWFPLGEALEEGPVELTYLWILFPDDGTGAVPAVLEIRTNP